MGALILGFILFLLLRPSTVDSNPRSDILEILIPPRRVFRFVFSPNMFDWSPRSSSSSANNDGIGTGREVEYFPSLKGRPDLPEWIDYEYSHKHKNGFIYGIPPKSLNSISLEIVALNKRSNALGFLNLLLNVISDTEEADEEDSSSLNAVHLKIDNLDVEDAFSDQRLQNLKSIFKEILWPESSSDLHLLFITSSLDLGYRRPLDPSEKDGVIIRLGSKSKFSKDLLNLDRETGPLRKKFPKCPERNFHRTTAERYFRSEGFALDWCAFRLMTMNIDANEDSSYRYEVTGVMKKTPSVVSSSLNDEQTGDTEGDQTKNALLPPRRSDIPQRDLSSAYFLSFFGSGLIFLGICIIIGIIIWGKKTSDRDESNEEVDEWEGFIESFYLVLSDCFKCCCFREVDGGTKRVPQQSRTNYLEQSFSTEMALEEIHPRSRRASSVQRQTDTLRRSALRKQREITPRLTSEKYYTPDEYVQRPRSVASSNQEYFSGETEDRPCPPPYYYGSSQIDDHSKSYLV